MASGTLKYLKTIEEKIDNIQNCQQLAIELPIITADLGAIKENLDNMKEKFAPFLDMLESLSSMNPKKITQLIGVVKKIIKMLIEIIKLLTDPIVTIIEENALVAAQLSVIMAKLNAKKNELNCSLIIVVPPPPEEIQPDP